MKKYLALLAVILLAGCGPKLTVGTVIEKSYEEAREWKDQKCDEEGCWTGTYYDDEDYILTVKGLEEYDQTDVTEKWYVNKYWYDIAEVGNGLSFHKEEMSAYDYDEWEDD